MGYLYELFRKVIYNKNLTNIIILHQIYIYIQTIVVCHNCFCICRILWQHYGISIFSIFMDIKKPPRIMAIDLKSSNNCRDNFGNYQN